jgi:hypothetical protein
VNERIKSLAIQAGLNVILEQHVREYGTGNWDDTPYPEVEKFAELIVRECIDILMKPEHTMTYPNKLSRYNEGWVKGRLLGIEHIKQHFGVKE